MARLGSIGLKVIKRGHSDDTDRCVMFGLTTLCTSGQGLGWMRVELRKEEV